MTASEKLTQLFKDDKLTDEQRDSLNDWNIELVSDVKDYLIDEIKVLRSGNDSIGYDEAVSALYELLDYDDDNYIVFNEDGVQELDFDDLDGALDID